jgi:hypothetical protein
MRAGMVTVKITRAETPDAKKLASAEASPACSKSKGAYCEALVIKSHIKVKWA